MKSMILSILIVSTSCLFAQKIVNKEIEVIGNIQLSDGISIPKINKGYTLWLPEEDNIKGAIVFTHPRRDSTSTDFIIDYAIKNELAVIYVTTDNRLEFFFEREKLQEVESYLHEAITTYNIPADNLLYCGMSLEGTRALKLAKFGHSEDSKHQIKPKAIAICDAPLDMVRFHREMVNTLKINFNTIATNEASWVKSYLEKGLRGTPQDNFDGYVDYSPFSYWAKDTDYLEHLADVSIRAYTEPDVNWWIENRRKDYYAMNAIDLAALINQLRILGNNKAELITTQNKGFNSDGSRHPHNWSIVNEKEMVDWFLNIINNDKP